MKEKNSSKKSKIQKRRTPHVQGGPTQTTAAATQERSASEEVTAGFKAGKDLEA